MTVLDGPRQLQIVLIKNGRTLVSGHLPLLPGVSDSDLAPLIDGIHRYSGSSYIGHTTVQLQTIAPQEPAPVVPDPRIAELEKECRDKDTVIKDRDNTIKGLELALDDKAQATVEKKKPLVPKVKAAKKPATLKKPAVKKPKAVKNGSAPVRSNKRR